MISSVVSGAVGTGTPTQAVAVSPNIVPKSSQRFFLACTFLISSLSCSVSFVGSLERILTKLSRVSAIGSGVLIQTVSLSTIGLFVVATVGAGASYNPVTGLYICPNVLAILLAFEIVQDQYLKLCAQIGVCQEVSTFPCKSVGCSSL